MRILQVVPHFYPAWSFGGIARVVYEISRELVRKGHDVTVHTANVLDQKTNLKASKHEYQIEGIKVRYYRNLAWIGGMNFTSDILQASTLREVKDSDIVNMHGLRTSQNVIAHYYTTRFRKPYVLTGHGTVPRVVEKIASKKLFDGMFGYRILRDASRVIAAAGIEMKQIVNMGISSDKVAVVPTGIDTEPFDTLPTSGAFKRKFGLDEESALILYVGRVHRRKGIGFLLDAFARLQSANAALVIAGPDDGYMSVMKERASCLRISEKVVFTGFISERAKLAAYVDSAVVVYPGIHESFGLVPLEAALCSRPVIVSDGSAMAEIVKQGGFGSSTTYGDSVQLMEVLRKMLRNPEIAEKMGQRGRQFVKENYNWPSIVTRLETLYSSSIKAG
jgi:glycosyltransferase involved in cell wall biosynthesis